MPAAPQYSYIDYWGTQVVAFNVDRGHEMLWSSATSLDRHPAAEDSRRRALGRGGRRVAHHGRLSLAQALHRAGTGAGRAAASLRASRPLETAKASWIGPTTPCATSRGVTDVHTSADEAFVDGAGVCQDFAHLALAMTKSVGLPSRYVSGYLHPEVDATVGWRSPVRATPGSKCGRGVVGLRPDQRLPRG